MPNPLSEFGLTDLELAAAMATDGAVMEGVKELAGRIEEAWKDIAPVFDAERDKRSTPGIGDPEDYKDSIHTELTRGKDGLPGARVGTNDPKAIWIEVGSAHMPEYAPATKVAQEFGDTTGPIFSEGVQRAQSKLREELETLAGLKAAGASAEHIEGQKRNVAAARQARSSAFKAARGGRRRRGRR